MVHIVPEYGIYIEMLMGVIVTVTSQITTIPKPDHFHQKAGVTLKRGQTITPKDTSQNAFGKGHRSGDAHRGKWI
jgi:hypothetical protein